MQERPDEMTEEDIEDLLKLYDAEIRYTDRQIGRVLDALREQEILDDTLVIITADHGEAFGEHDRFGHHPYPYEELIRVPLIVAGPGVTSTTVDQQVSLLDLAPTILDLVDADIPDTMEGESFATALTGSQISTKTALTISNNSSLYGCRTPKWKYIATDEGEELLFDLEADPKESNDVCDENPEIADQFSSIIDDYRENVATGENETSIDHSPEVQRRLEDLGYVD